MEDYKTRLVTDSAGEEIARYMNEGQARRRIQWLIEKLTALDSVTSFDELFRSPIRRAINRELARHTYYLSLLPHGSTQSARLRFMWNNGADDVGKLLPTIMQIAAAGKLNRLRQCDGECGRWLFAKHGLKRTCPECQAAHAKAHRKTKKFQKDRAKYMKKYRDENYRKPVSKEGKIA